VHTEHVKYDLMDYVTERVNIEERIRIEQHLQICSHCNAEYNKLLSADAVLKKERPPSPAPVYYSTILPRVRDRLVSQKRFIWNYDYGATKIILPLAVAVLIVVLFMRVPTNSTSESAQIDALHQAVKDFNDEEVVQAVEREYTGLSFVPSQGIAAAGVAEHLQGDQFLKSALSKQIENEEIVEMDVEGMISDLDGEQVDQVLSELSERNVL
jgi:anti-sigma factor RsiW